MTWGTFSNTHIATLVLGFAAILIIYFVLVSKSRRSQILTLFAISLACAGGVIYTMFNSDDMVHNLPLELWSLSALLLPYAIITRHKWCCNLLLLWPVQSLILLVFNYDKASMNVFSVDFLIYFFTHVLIFGIPLVMFWLRLVHRNYKYIKRSLIITVLVYTAVHFANVALGTNYLYSRGPNGNAFLAFFYTFVPEYWYMFSMLPFFMFYLGWWYLPEILDHRRKRKRLKTKLKQIDDYYDEYEDEYIDEIIEEKYGH